MSTNPHLMLLSKKHDVVIADYYNFLLKGGSKDADVTRLCTKLYKEWAQRMGLDLEELIERNSEETFYYHPCFDRLTPVFLEGTRTMVYNFFLSHPVGYNKVDVPMLIAYFKREKSLPHSAYSLHVSLRRLNFKQQGNCLIEKTSSRAKRIDYLRKIKEYRESGCSIVYLYLKFACLPYTKKKLDHLGHNETTERYLIMHASDGDKVNEVAMAEAARCNKSKLLFSTTMFRAENNYTWFSNKVCPKLPIDSVIVVDENTYEEFVLPYAPSVTDSLYKIKAWLSKMHIKHPENALKTDLMALIKKYKASYLEIEYGLKVLLIPANNPSLNPLESIWRGELETMTVSVYPLTDTFEYTRHVSRILEKTELYEKMLMNREELIDKIEFVSSDQSGAATYSQNADANDVVELDDSSDSDME